MDQHVSGKQAVTETLLAALRQDEFLLYAQPIIALKEKTHASEAGIPTFQEILVRFQEEEEKLLPPGSFIPVLESCGLMHFLDRWVAQRSIRWLRTFQKLRPAESPPRCSANLAPDTLCDAGFAAYVERKLGEAQVPASALAYEIFLPDALDCAAELEKLIFALRPMGCAFTFSAFDGGAEAFTLLRRFRADYVKLGVNLVSHCDLDGRAALALEAIHRRCHDMGLRTIAEHVERPATLEVLRGIGVDFAQGFHIGVPQPLN